MMIGRPSHRQSLPAPINLKDDITVEVALLHRYGIITTLLFSNLARTIFAQRKPNGRLSASAQNQQSHHTRLRKQQPTS